MRNPFVRIIQSRVGYRTESFIVGWYTTLKIKFKHPDVYRDLCCAFCEDDFVEVDRPTPKLDALMAEEDFVEGRTPLATWLDEGEEPALDRAQRLGKTWKLLPLKEDDKLESLRGSTAPDALTELEREVLDGEEL